jgi:asparagine synthase (glutamine-hydrolysing)
MCGIVGIWGPASRDLRENLARMAHAIRHRGPDDEGFWSDEAEGIGLAHRRLSIVDLSPQGHQPMASACGRYEISYNGEIYNHREIRAELDALDAPAWRGHSDTEVLLAAISRWGLEDALRRSVGMFAFALWDRSERSLRLVRDRLGEKPLYYGWIGGAFAFSSELKALRQHPQWNEGIDREALGEFMRFGYIPAPRTIHPGFRKLPPASILTVTRPHDRARPAARLEGYWSVGNAARSGIRNVFQGSEAEAIEQLEGLIFRSVGQQMVADVPLGAFLSGGIDSSTVVASMQRQSARPVKTFTIGFGEDDYDEAAFAGAVARHLGTDHEELRLSAREAMDVVPLLPTMYDEPFADPSQIPTYLVSQLARGHVTVSLSGDAGDELFGGYPRYPFADGIRRKAKMLPRFVRHAASRAIAGVPPAAFGWLPDSVSGAVNGRRATRLANVLAADGRAEMYLRMVSQWQDPRAIVLGFSNTAGDAAPRDEDASFDFFSYMMLWDSENYLPDDILVKLDRASMAVSLESRVPFLDHRIVEFAWTLPLAVKHRDGTGKWVLRKVLDRHVPAELIDRPKMGFGAPIGSWIRGPMREWAEELLSEHRLRREGFLDAKVVRECWVAHRDGRRDHQFELWSVLMFQAWLENQNAGSQQIHEAAAAGAA